MPLIIDRLEASSYVNIVKRLQGKVSGFHPLIAATEPPSTSRSRLLPPSNFLPILRLPPVFLSFSFEGRHDHQRMRAAVAVLAVALSVSLPSSVLGFELETTSTTVECVQCIQLWKSASVKESKACGPHAKTCTGDACFMRQCKHCPVYQYMSGCLQLSPWQLSDLETNRRASELRMRRVGAELLCEDSFNQTTCICNRRDKCNSIHSRLPYSTYADGIFKGVVDFDQVIGAIDPRYLEVISGYQYRFSLRSSSGLQLAGFSLFSFLLLFL